VHFCKLKIADLILAKKVVWHGLENRLRFTQDKNEWKGTDIVFEVLKKGNETKIRFTRRGLVPECERFDVCVPTHGGSYINRSLRSLMVTGKGRPNQKEVDGEKAAQR
jgi:hypothetical protein